MAKKILNPIPTMAAPLGLEGDPEQDQLRARTYPGQAHFATAPYGGPTCRQCLHWNYAANANRGIRYAETGMLKSAHCNKARALMLRADLPKVPHYAPACKYFEANADPPESFDSS